MKKIISFIFVFLFCFSCFTLTSFAEGEELPPVEETYTITFDSNGGNEIETITYSKLTENLLLPTPEKKGYNFVGWYHEGVYIDKVNSGEEKNLNLVAKYTLWKYYVTFIDGYYNDEIILPSIYYTIEDEGFDLTLPEFIPTKEGYKFLGWYEFNSREKVEKIDVQSAAPFLLYAKWEEIKEEIEYTFTYEDEIIKFYVSGDKCRIVIDEEEDVVNCEIKDNILYLYVEGEVFPAQINDDNTLTPITEEDLLPCKVNVLKSEFGDVVAEVNAGNIGDVLTFKVKPYVFYKVTSVKVNDVDLLPNEEGMYSFSLVEGENNIVVTYEVDNEQLEVIAKNIANAKNGNWEEIFTFENLAQIITWIITIFFSGGFLTVLLKNKKVQAKTSDEVIGITNDTISKKFDEVINNFLDNKLEPVLTKINDKLVSTDEVCKTLARCFVLSQENTPEARLAIISELTTLQKSSEDLSQQVKAVILEEVARLNEIEEKKKQTIKELEESNNSIKPEEIIKDNGRY